MSATSATSAVPAPSGSSAPSALSAPSAEPAPASHPAAHRRPLPSRADVPSDSRPTLKDLQTSTARRQKVKATRGLPGLITRLTGGVISPAPGRKERLATERLERIRRPLDGPRNIAVVNLKGGAHKTTASLMIAATLGVTRGGNVLAWDNNETRGTLGWRGVPTDHHRTAVDLLRFSPEVVAAPLLRRLERAGLVEAEEVGAHLHRLHRHPGVEAARERLARILGPVPDPPDQPAAGTALIAVGPTLPAVPTGRAILTRPGRTAREPQAPAVSRSGAGAVSSR